MHGFNSGYYKLASKNKNDQPVYADVTAEKLDVYQQVNKQPARKPFLSILLLPSDSLMFTPMVFHKTSLDIDITSVLLKLRPAVHGLQQQLTTDFNIAVYAGWRYDRYVVSGKKNPLGRHTTRINNLGYDFGVFAGPGVTLVSPFTTGNNRTDEYSGMIIQAGIAGFLETTVASFGVAAGYDHLANPDRKVWIYRNRPWVGFIVGIAIN
jgi:hypothetical protein